MDYGYPQFTEAQILAEYIKTDAYKMEVSHCSVVGSLPGCNNTATVYVSAWQANLAQGAMHRLCPKFLGCWQIVVCMAGHAANIFVKANEAAGRHVQLGMLASNTGTCYHELQQRIRLSRVLEASVTGSV